MSRYGLALAALERYREAEEPLLEAHRRLKDANLPNHPAMREVVQALADVYEKTNRPDEAAKKRAELATLAATTRP
jgi:hypothetical protein